MEAYTILDARYSSHINGTAREGSDDDTVFVFLRKEHVREFPLSKNTDPEIRLSKERSGQPLWKFIRDCMFGVPLSLDLLFLPPHAYIVRPPEILWDHRSIFVTRTALRSYISFAAFKRRQSAMSAASVKARYHSLIYLNSARNIILRGAPTFFDPAFVETLQAVRSDGARFEAEYETLSREIATLSPRLPEIPDWKLVNTIYEDLARIADEGSDETWACGGCGTGIPAEPAPSPATPMHPSDRGGDDWWKVVGPLLWEELHRWALSPENGDSHMWLAAFASRIPCGSCKQHWIEWTAANPPPAGMAEMFAWTVMGHDAVNERLKKDQFTMARAMERWAT